MRICCCVKRVPAPGARINVTPDGQEVDTAHLGFTTSPHEECGVEEAVQLTEAHGGEVTVLTLGPPEAAEQLRYAASVGAHHGVLVPTDGSAWDPQRTARALTSAIEILEEAEGPFDLLIFGNESADSGGFQVGVRVAVALGRPIVGGIKGIEIDGATVRARRQTDAGFEVYELPMPAAVGVKEGINLPRYPTMRGRLASKRLEVGELPAEALRGGQSMRLLHRPADVTSETVILGEGHRIAEGARLLGIGERQTRKRAVGMPLVRHIDRRRQTSRGKRMAQGLRADPAQGGVDDRRHIVRIDRLTIRAKDRTADGCADVLGDHRPHVEALDVVPGCQFTAGRKRRQVHARFDAPVERRPDLRPVGPVHLQAVVVAGVVACRDHQTGCR